MTPEELKSIAESLIFAAGNPISLRRLAEVIGVAQADIKPALSLLRQEYEAAGRGIIFAEVAGGYQLRTAPVHAEYVKMLLQEKPSKLSRAALETLAIIAYRQPITKIEIESVRGVTVDGVLNSLLTKKLIREMGRKDVPGRPWVYGTTQQFLELFGLTDLDSLPALPDIHEPSLNPFAETDTEDVAEPSENAAVQELQEDMQEEDGVPHRNDEDPTNETITQALEANDQNNQDSTSDDASDQASQAGSEEANLARSISEQGDESGRDQGNAASQSSSESIAAAAQSSETTASSGTSEQTLGTSGDSVQESSRPSDPSRESTGERPDDHSTGDDGGSET